MTGNYRYRLRRVWSCSELFTPERTLCVVMLNPSTDDDSSNLPTIRRVGKIARDGGFGGIEIVNLYALRVTNPLELLAARDPVGPENDAAIEAAAKDRTVLCAWGAFLYDLPPQHGSASRCVGRARIRDVGLVLARVARRLVCLGRTRGGAPRHPLYVPAAQGLESFEVE